MSDPYTKTPGPSTASGAPRGIFILSDPIVGTGNIDAYVRISLADLYWLIALSGDPDAEPDVMFRPVPVCEGGIEGWRAVLSGPFVAGDPPAVPAQFQ